MSELNEVLARVRDKLKDYRALYEQNEMAVRDQIINPILRALAWNPEDPEEVQPNVSTDEGILDYSLLSGGKPVLFVEAKNLSTDVENRDVVRQLAKYAFGEGTKYGVITNGTTWLLTKSFEEGTTLAERIVWKTDVLNEGSAEVARKLLTISKPNVANIERLVKKALILDEIWRSLLGDPREIIRGLMPAVKGLLAQGYPEYEFSQEEIEDLLKERVEEMVSGVGEESVVPDTAVATEGVDAPGPPRRMKLSGERYDLRYAYEILVNTANWLIKQGKMRASDCPVAVGRGSRNLVSVDKKHRYGKDFFLPRKLSNGLWIETHSSSAATINYAKRLLEKFGYSADTLTIE